ncbi:hypothetical protein EV368DRAFT_75814 [Lentinula lateritia]|uniref:Uncharacterized protein n=1 Tax=Lentinula aff. lateritia TaxID=2804960 RepID=A0ACC1U6T2_9AGAR|nr:hypothetical protein F5876DRAFT_87780 [Lentinula aff. lateritia]KAJ3849222.1 hypothetical protein EV368DRAFT_75814 [Lentinula lateritia]
MSETVIRERIDTLSSPFARFGIFPVGGRSTAVKMRNGNLWVLASTPLDTETKAKLEELGPVKFIIGADAVHHLFLSDFKKAYPEAKIIAPKAAIERVQDKTLKFDGAWGSDPEDTRYGFEEDVSYFSGFSNKDVAFFHPASKTMIQADLLFNLPPTEQYSKSKSSGHAPLVGNFGPFSWFHAKFASAMGEDKKAMQRDVKTVASWDFERIIPCHGDVIEAGAKDAWRAAYKAYLN